MQEALNLQSKIEIYIDESWLHKLEIRSKATNVEEINMKY